MTTSETGPSVKGPGKFAARLPLVLFLLLGGLFFYKLVFTDSDTSRLPSAFINKPAPETDLPALPGFIFPGIKSQDFIGKVTLVNVWGSWCGPCRAEHPQLLELARDNRIVLAGFNYKDTAANAGKFLNELGNPYDVIGVDETGRQGIEWGVYGVPETFLVNNKGIITYKFIGPISAQSLTAVLMPKVEEALAQQASD